MLSGCRRTYERRPCFVLCSGWPGGRTNSPSYLNVDLVLFCAQAGQEDELTVRPTTDSVLRWAGRWSAHFGRKIK